MLNFAVWVEYCYYDYGEGEINFASKESIKLLLANEIFLLVGIFTLEVVS